MTTLRTVTNSGAPLVNADGSLAVGVTLTFQLTDTFGNPITATDSTSHQSITGIATAMTDDTGVFTVSLWPNDQGTPPSRYLCVCQALNIRMIGIVPTASGSLTFQQFFTG